MNKRDYIRQKAEVMSQTLDEILPTYERAEGEDPIASCLELPSEREVVRVLMLFDAIFFPGYREQCPGLSYASGIGYPLETMVTERLDESYDVLYRQVTRAIPYRWRSEYARQIGLRQDAVDVQTESEAVVGHFFARLPRIRELLKGDVVAAYNGDPAAKGFAEVILSYPAIRAMTTHRIAHELYRLDVPIIPRMMSEWVHGQTGIDIHPGATIGEGFFLDHGTGVVIGETTVIGDRVRIYQGVTLGARRFPTDEHGMPVKGLKRHPTIEDDVVIYPGATILGDITIGARSVIGGNVWLHRNIAPDSKIAGGPPDRNGRHRDPIAGKNENPLISANLHE